MPGDKWELDHKVALCNGGTHSEDNLAPALADKHKAKTAADVAEKSKVARMRAKHLGSVEKRPWSKYRRRMNGTVELRDGKTHR